MSSENIKDIDALYEKLNYYNRMHCVVKSREIKAKMMQLKLNIEKEIIRLEKKFGK